MTELRAHAVLGGRPRMPEALQCRRNRPALDPPAREVDAAQEGSRIVDVALERRAGEGRDRLAELLQLLGKLEDSSPCGAIRSPDDQLVREQVQPPRKLFEGLADPQIGIGHATLIVRPTECFTEPVGRQALRHLGEALDLIRLGDEEIDRSIQAEAELDLVQGPAQAAAALLELGRIHRQELLDRDREDQAVDGAVRATAPELAENLLPLLPIIIRFAGEVAARRIEHDGFIEEPELTRLGRPENPRVGVLGRQVEARLLEHAALAAALGTDDQVPGKLVYPGPTPESAPDLVQGVAKAPLQILGGVAALRSGRNRVAQIRTLESASEAVLVLAFEDDPNHEHGQHDQHDAEHGDDGDEPVLRQEAEPGRDGGHDREADPRSQNRTFLEVEQRHQTPEGRGTSPPAK